MDVNKATVLQAEKMVHRNN